jgi:hypothetical protein
MADKLGWTNNASHVIDRGSTMMPSVGADRELSSSKHPCPFCDALSCGGGGSCRCQRRFFARFEMLDNAPTQLLLLPLSSQLRRFSILNSQRATSSSDRQRTSSLARQPAPCRDAFILPSHIAEFQEDFRKRSSSLALGLVDHILALLLSSAFSGRQIQEIPNREQGSLLETKLGAFSCAANSIDLKVDTDLI